MNLVDIATRNKDAANKAKVAFRQRPNKEEEWGKVDEMVAMAYGDYIDGGSPFPEAVMGLVSSLKSLLI